MKPIPFVALLLAVFTSTAFAVAIGDSYSDVLAAKGPPTGKMERAGMQVLRYPDMTVTLKNGKVASVEAKKTSSAAVAAAKVAPAAPPVPVAPPRSTAAVPPLLARSVAATWMTNFPAALAQAKQDDRHVFLFFTGSDWCGWCMRLQKEILKTPQFAAFAAEKLVLVELDFPKRKPMSDAVKAQNQQLAQRFGIRGFPTVIVLDQTGNPVAKLGYQEGGPGPFIERLRGL